MPTKAPTVVRLRDSFAFDLSAEGLNACYGVVVRNGALINMPKLVKCANYSFIKGLMGGVGKNVYAHFPQGVMIYQHSTSLTLKGIVAVPNTVTCFCKYRDKFYLTYDNKAVYKLDTKGYTVLSDETAITAIAFVNDTLVALQNGKRLYFADAGDERITFTETDGSAESPYVELPAACQAMVSFKHNELYLLGEECYKLTVFSDFSNVKLEHIASLGVPVSKWTVKVVNDKVVFATDNGLYVIEGDKVKRIFTDLDKAVSNDYSACRASVVLNKYVLSRPYGEGSRAYVLDVDKQRCLGVLSDEVWDVVLHNGRGFAVTTDDCLKEYLPYYGYEQGVFAREQVDFGTNSRKFLRRLNIHTKFDVEVIISDDNGSRSLLIYGSDKLQSIPLTGSGVAFDYRILSRGQMSVDYFELVAHIYKEEYYGS